MKKLLAILLLCAILLARPPITTAAAKSGALPTAWDLTNLYASDTAWHAALAGVGARVPDLAAYRGKLGDPQALLAFIELKYALMADAEQLYEYAALRSALYVTDGEAATMLNKAAILFGQIAQEAAFMDAELFAINPPARKKLLASAPLAPYEYDLSWYLDADNEPMCEEAASLLSFLLPALNPAQDIYQTFIILELPHPTLTLDDGRQVVLDDAAYWEYLGSDRSRAEKIAATQAYNGRYDAYLNTLTALFNAHVWAGWSEAMAYGYDSTLAYMMDMSLLDPAIHDLLIEQAHDHLPLLQRYYALRAKALDLAPQYPFDAAYYVSAFSPGFYDYEDAVALVREALAPLGGDYLAMYDRIVRAGHIDIYEAQGRGSGAFTYPSPNGVLPYVLLNYHGYAGDVSTLAHEMGHAVYYALTAENQPSCYLYADTFTQEVAAMLNELLLARHLCDSARSDEERLCHLEDAIDLFVSGFFMQAMYAEFEHSMYTAAQDGEALNADALGEAYAALYDLYFGGTVERLEGEQNAWMGVSHFISYRYYVYQYATSLVYALALYERIAAGDGAARDAYLAMLARGASAEPMRLLLEAGVDPVAPQTYQIAMRIVESWLDEYEHLIGVQIEPTTIPIPAKNLFGAPRAAATPAPTPDSTRSPHPAQGIFGAPRATDAPAPTPAEAVSLIQALFGDLRALPTPTPALVGP